MKNLVDNYCEFPTIMRRPMWQIWHKLLIKFDKDSSVNFMNYGYSGLNDDKSISLNKKDENNRYCIQLYDHVINQIEVKDKRVIEVGSGRGGGADYIARYYKPKQYIGVDISNSVIKFCNRLYQTKGLFFKYGRAEKIPAKSNSCDVIVNVESARCYSNIESFFNEVKRVLNKNGHFCFADMIEKNEVKSIRKKLAACGFSIQSEIEITKNVAKGLELDNIRREQLIKRKIPAFLHKHFKIFAGTKGTSRFNSFINGTFEYRSFVLVQA